MNKHPLPEMPSISCHSLDCAVLNEFERAVTLLLNEQVVWLSVLKCSTLTEGMGSNPTTGILHHLGNAVNTMSRQGFVHTAPT